jgi:hypothetical protein
MSLIDTFSPKSDESGLGYYRRLAKSNSLQGWKELAALANVKQSRGSFSACPENMAESLGLEDEWTKCASQQEQLSRSWRGLHRSKVDALCPECLAEDSYVRRFWEHAYATACPVHGNVLLDRCLDCGESLSVDRPCIERCACGCDLRTASVKRASTSQRWVSALLSTGGSSTGGIPPLVHAPDIGAVADFVRLLCRYAQVGSPPLKQGATTPSSIAQATEILKPLDSFLSEWPSGFESHVRERIAAGTPSARTLTALLGDWYQQLKQICRGNALEPFLRAVLKVASKEFDADLGHDLSSAASTDISEYMTAPMAAKLLCVSTDKLLKAVRSQECLARTRRRGTRGLLYEIPKAEVIRLRDLRAGWISEGQACAIAGITKAVLQNMVAAGVIRADLLWRNDIEKGGPVEISSLTLLYEKLTHFVAPRATSSKDDVFWLDLTSKRMGDKQAIQMVMQAASRGDLRAVHKGKEIGTMTFSGHDVSEYFGTPTLESGMTIEQLTKETGWKWESVSHWVNLGLLESTRIMLRGQPCSVILPQHLLRFRQTFLPLADLARALGTKPSALAQKLSTVELIGAKPLPDGSKRGGLLRVADLGRLATIGARVECQQPMLC